MILAAAVEIDGVIRTLPAPARHHDVMKQYPLPDHRHGEQGFIDHEIGFVDRRQAGRIALEEGQIDKMQWPPRLFSEDLW